MSDRPCVAKSVITNSSILRDVVQNLSGENRVDIAQDFGRTDIVRAGVGTGYDLACCIDKNPTWDSVAGVFPNCVFAFKFLKIDSLATACLPRACKFPSRIAIYRS